MVTWLQAINGERSPGAAGFGPEGGRATEVYFVHKSEVHAAIGEALGTSVATGGTLARTLPKAHPKWDHLYCSAISSITGIGHREDSTETYGEEVDAEEGLEAEALTDAYWDYPYYRFELQFTSRPFAVLTDETIDGTLYDMTWYDVDGTEYSSPVRKEWIRFTHWQYEHGYDVAYAQHGNLLFRRGDGTAEGSPRPHLYTFSGFPRTNIPKATIHFHWYGVPLEWLEHADSPLVLAQGRINQSEWYGWGKGTLLYHSPRIIRMYAPPVPEWEVWFDTVSPSTRKLVDLDLVFEETFRESPSAPAEPLANPNWIPAGWNLGPWLGAPGDYFYVTTPDEEAAKQYPLFRSFPFQLLFQDPETIYS